MKVEKANIDRFGHCVICHKPMIIEKVIDQRPQLRFIPEYDTMRFLLNTNSLMRVAVCKTCKPDVKDKDHKQIMKAVINGWDLETKMLVKDKNKPEWDEAKRKKYMDDFSTREIVCLADGKAKDILDKKLKEYKEKKHGSN